MLRHIRVIQGGMGVNVSSPTLARSVSTYGAKPTALGTVSGVAAPHVLMRILKNGDPGGHYRRALAHFPFPGIAEEVLARHFVPEGSFAKRGNQTVWMYSLTPARELIILTIVANFALVWLAKEGHDRPVSINYLEKAPLPHLHSIYGAMLAGVDVVTVGAGIPLQIPAILDAYAKGQTARYRVLVEGGEGAVGTMEFDPSSFFGTQLPPLSKPAFLPIVSLDSLASILVNKLPGAISGFVVEGPTAGGHNAGPRGNPKRFNERGEPLYGEKDSVNFDKMRNLELPFWIGGGVASPEGLAYARVKVRLGYRQEASSHSHKSQA